MVDLGVCIEAIRRAFVYGNDIIKYRQHPRSISVTTAHIATKRFLKALKTIAENCPVDDYFKDSLLEMYRRGEESPWKTTAKYLLYEYIIHSYIEKSLRQLAEYFGFDYEKYIPD